MKQVSSLEEVKQFFSGKTYAVAEIFSPGCGPCKALEYQLDSSEIPSVKISVADIGSDFLSLHGLRSVPAVMLSSTVERSEVTLLRSPITVVGINSALQELKRLATHGAYVLILEDKEELYFGTAGKHLGFQYSKEAALKFSSREEALRVIGELELPIQTGVRLI